MSAMMAFMAAKAEYDALPPDAPRDALHEKHAKTALDFALAHRGVYIKAGQFIASLQGGAGELRPHIDCGCGLRGERERR